MVIQYQKEINKKIDSFYALFIIRKLIYYIENVYSF
jgi:hypothetical protein